MFATRALWNGMENEGDFMDGILVYFGRYQMNMRCGWHCACYVV